MTRLTFEPNGETFEISAEGLTIGSSSDVDLCLSHPNVAARHCRIYLTRDGIVCEHLGGDQHATLINGQAITWAWLGDGYRISCGPYNMVFDASPAVVPAMPPIPSSPSKGNQPPKRINKKMIGALLTCLILICVVVLIAVLAPRIGSNHGDGPEPQAIAFIPDPELTVNLPPLDIHRGAELSSSTIKSDQPAQIHAGPLSLNVPIGAFSMSTRVTVYEASTPAPEWELQPIGSDERIPAEVLVCWEIDVGEGSGLFNLPIEVEINLGALPQGLPAVAIPLISLDGSTWTKLPSTREGNMLRFSTRHFSPISLVGLAEAAALVLPVAVTAYLIYDRAREFPSWCQKHAPYVTIEPSPTSFDIYWSTKLPGLDPKTGHRKVDNDHLVKELKKLNQRFMDRAGNNDPNSLSWPLHIRTEFDHALNRLLRSLYGPPQLKTIDKALMVAQKYLKKRNIKKPFLDLPVYIAPSLPDGDAGYIHNPWTGRRYMFLNNDTNAKTIYTTALHELFHHYQTGYIWIDRNGHVPLMEATALLLEREAKPEYEKKGLPFNLQEGLGLAQFVVYQHGLDGPASGEEEHVRSFGYGLTWFIEYLRDNRSAGSQAEFQSDLLNQWSNTTFDALHKSLVWAAGGSEDKLRKSYIKFAEEMILNNAEANAGLYSPYGRAYKTMPLADNPYQMNTNKSTLKKHYGLLPSVTATKSDPYHRLGDKQLNNWAIHFFKYEGPGRPTADLVVRVPRSWTPETGPRRDVFLRQTKEETDASPISGMDLAPADAEHAVAVLDLEDEAFVYMVDTGLRGGWVTSIPEAEIFLLEPPEIIAPEKDAEGLWLQWIMPHAASAGAPYAFYRLYLNGSDVPNDEIAIDTTSLNLGLGAYGVDTVTSIKMTSAVYLGMVDNKLVYLESEPVEIGGGPPTGTLGLELDPRRKAEGVQCQPVGIRSEDLYTFRRKLLEVTLDKSGRFKWEDIDDDYDVDEMTTLRGTGTLQGKRLTLDASWSYLEREEVPMWMIKSGFTEYIVKCRYRGTIDMAFNQERHPYWEGEILANCEWERKLGEDSYKCKGRIFFGVKLMTVY